MKALRDNIVAIATPPGKGGIGIIRISGENALTIATKITQKKLSPRIATFCHFYNHEQKLIDQGVAIYFPKPHSFTGEEVVELQTHGSMIILDWLMETAVQFGARRADPGEFSKRAFLNNKIDLTQAEAIADLIESHSRQAAFAAMQSLQGEFSKAVHQLTEELIAIRIHVEASIDFTEEEIEVETLHTILPKINAILEKIAALIAKAQQGRLLRDGITIVITGEPNAGKSTFLNALLEEERAIVTDIPGTTRDILREYFNIDGMPITIMDTAGLRDSADLIEQEGIKRAKAAMHIADIVLLILDIRNLATLPLQLQHIPDLTKVLLLINKIDLTQHVAEISSVNNLPAIYLSAKNNNGIDLVKQYIKKISGLSNDTTGVFSSRARHIEALQQAKEHLQQALEQTQAFELMAEELTQAQHALNEITGEFSSDDLLGRIFSTFCVGK